MQKMEERERREATGAIPAHSSSVWARLILNGRPIEGLGAGCDYRSENVSIQEVRLMDFDSLT